MNKKKQTEYSKKIGETIGAIAKELQMLSMAQAYLARLLLKLDDMPGGDIENIDYYHTRFVKEE